MDTFTISFFISDENKTLAPSYDVGWDFFDTMVRDHIAQYNYTLNQVGFGRKSAVILPSKE